ncbi:MAG: hypothetical protein QXN08_06200 [Nitrososphaerales archaeon]
MKCLLCWRESKSKYGLCFYHDEAYRSLKEGYQRWCRAYDNISEVKYLERLLELPECGEWIKEVAKMELKRIKERS